MYSRLRHDWFESESEPIAPFTMWPLRTRASVREMKTKLDSNKLLQDNQSCVICVSISISIYVELQRASVTSISPN